MMIFTVKARKAIRTDWYSYCVARAISEIDPRIHSAEPYERPGWLVRRWLDRRARHEVFKVELFRSRP